MIFVLNIQVNKRDEGERTKEILNSLNNQFSYCSL